MAPVYAGPDAGLAAGVTWASGCLLPIQRAAHHRADLAAGPDVAVGIDFQFDDGVVADLAALADAIEAAGAGQGASLHSRR